MKHLVSKLAAGALALATLGSAAAAQETTLRLSNWLPPSHPIVKDIVMPWKAQVEEATEGRVEIQVLDAPLGPPPRAFRPGSDRRGRHHLRRPRLHPRPLRADRHRRTAVPDPERRGAFGRPLAPAREACWPNTVNMRASRCWRLWGHGPGHLFTTGREVTPLDELGGAKIRVAGAVTNQLAEEMGMVPLQAPAPKTYELLSGGVADGIYFPSESIPFFKLDSIVTKALRVPGGLYNVSFFFVMNQDAWDGLSEEDRAAIDEVSGEALARMAGQAWDAADEAGLAVMEGKVAFHDATEAEMEALRADAEAVYDTVRDKVEAKGVDFDAALQMLKDETEAVAAE